MSAVLRSRADLAATTSGWKQAGGPVGVVPTMGALHEGHLALVRRALAECPRVVATIFVNPKQFNDASDLDAYPRSLQSDLDLLAAAGVHAVFAPPADEIYPPDFATTISIGGVALELEGRSRPGHFDGVATVVARLLNLTRADRAYFGEKDWQQLQVVHCLVRDLALPVTIVGCETARAPDGLAFSSRNRRLSADGRKRAPALFAALTRAAERIRTGGAGAPRRGLFTCRLSRASRCADPARRASGGRPPPACRRMA